MIIRFNTTPYSRTDYPRNWDLRIRVCYALLPTIVYEGVIWLEYYYKVEEWFKGRWEKPIGLDYTENNKFYSIDSAKDAAISWGEKPPYRYTGKFNKV